MTTAQYMRQVLVNPLSGYYMHGDVFGTEGDFVTSPEISQMFGELAGVWYLTEWMRLGKPAKTQIIEFGPGRGTLMSDMLRALGRFPYFYETITGVHLIEASPGLRKMQRATLVEGSEDSDMERIAGDEKNAPVETITRSDGVKISWHDGIEFVPQQWSLIMAHEFFDAIPIHSFEKTEEGWREMLIDMDDTDETEYNFRIVRSPTPTTASKAFLEQQGLFPDHKPGDRVEISPDSWDFMSRMAKLLDTHGGAGLIVDYGQDYVQGDTLRAIRKHRIVHPMSDPGSADLSADVDFAFLKQVIAKESSVTSYGPVTQSQFLQSLGIQTRLEMLLKNAKSHESRSNIVKGFQRLLDPAEMGRIYKVLAFAKETSKTAEPVGFGSA
ncbi:NADH dehydrogenase [ubiquinone] complex I, assembly factor 7 [Apophysomyces sp. BC1034]|nr:NADH dehydrogenase [ubiquinone] complex I, assembly factor 7 [Apophysomyces sp. BC1015]KAG0176098.1 NADH dehydrogenase [ubiquinone] complex I, assembly factor 7 [Apophysomyces sp. BC1021]KAG0186473.1 NADH dehydrogenase [ubiquinone] complex I, assembly factor 7 [Apophysomyces sp. BC1034]